MPNVIKTQQTELFWATAANVVTKATAVSGITGLAGARPPVDTSDLAVGADATYIAGVAQPQQISVSVNVRRGEVAHRALLNLRDSGELVSWGIYSSDATAVPIAVGGELQAASGRVSVRFWGYVADVQLTMDRNDIWRGTVVIQRSGGFTYDIQTPEEEILSLFAAGEQGVWYDPADFSTLFQDAAGTIPVTALEQPVGRMLDKSGRGNHATQATAAARPVVSARLNLMQASEDLLNVAWQRVGVQGTADTLVPTTASAQHYAAQTFLQAAGAQYVVRFRARAQGYRYLRVGPANSNSYAVCLDLQSATVAAQTGPGSVTIAAAGDGWCDCSVTFTAATTIAASVVIGVNDAVSTSTLTFAGDGTSGVGLTRVDARMGAQAGYRYQRAVTATDYDAVGFPIFLRFDGADDCLFTQGNVDMSASSSMHAVAGLRKVAADAADGVVAELGDVYGAAPGRFVLAASPSGGPNCGWYVRGATGTTGRSFPFANGDQAVVTGSVTWSSLAPRTAIKRNGILAQEATNVGGSGVRAASAPLFVGRRNNAGAPFNGSLHGFLLVSRLLTSSEEKAAEAFMAQRSGITL